jgi:hypothetical protein
VEKTTKEGKMGLDAHKCFAEMDEYRNMHDGIWVEVVELKTIVIKKATEKVTGGEGQFPFNKILKQDSLVDILVRIRLMERRALLNNMPFLKMTLFHKTQEVVSGALTVIPVAFRRFGLLLLLVLLPLVGGLRFTHPCGHGCLYLHKLGGCGRGDTEVRKGGCERRRLVCRRKEGEEVQP